jgi:hypothetical protein
LVLFALLAITCLPVALIVHVLVELPLRFVAVRLIVGLELLIWRPQATAMQVAQSAAPGPVANAR